MNWIISLCTNNIPGNIIVVPTIKYSGCLYYIFSLIIITISEHISSAVVEFLIGLLCIVNLFTKIEGRTFPSLSMEPNWPNIFVYCVSISESALHYMLRENKFTPSSYLPWCSRLRQAMCGLSHLLVIEMLLKLSRRGYHNYISFAFRLSLSVS